MKKRFLLYLGVLFYAAVNAQEVKRPKLIVGIVVDQMRYDYLVKFNPYFGEEGFKKLMNKGFSANNLDYDYKPTYTGPGHASIFTGTSPSVHGIVSNNWYSREEGRSIYCAYEYLADGSIEANPKRMKSQSFADEMKQFFNFRSKSYGVSLKDRGAIFPAGHLADGAYWFDAKLGAWTTSAYYPNAKPNWLAEFNRQGLSAKYLGDQWELSDVLKKEAIPYSNDSKHEKHFIKGEPTVFPYQLKKLYAQKGDALLMEVPQGNQMTADLAMQLIKNESLGSREVSDFISVSFSTTDYVGHRFGVQSMEVLDTYVKLDQTLAEFISFLEKELGQDNFLLFLSSDHGAGMPISYLKEKGLPHGRINAKSIKNELDSALDETFTPRDWVVNLSNLNIYFNDSIRQLMGKNFREVEVYTIQWLEKRPEFASAYLSSSVEKLNGHIGSMVAKGILRKESGDIVMVENPNWSNYSLAGSTHGSPYRYDTHVPALFYGTNVKPGQSNKHYTIGAIISTVAKLSGIPFQNTNEKQVIVEVLE